MFTNDAESYMNHCAGDEESRAVTKHWNKLNIQGNERKTVLDIGCGTGNITKELAKTPGVFRMDGFDNSQHMILYAKNNCKATNISFYVDDVTKPRLTRKGMYDIIFSNMTMHWIRHQKAALRNINLMLKPGGNLLLQMLVQPSGSRAAALQAIGDNVFWEPYLRGYDPEWIFNKTDEENHNWLHPDPFAGYCTLLKDAGFHMLPGSEVIYKSEKLPISNQTVGFLRRRQAAISPHHERIPEKLQEKFMDEYMEAFIDALPRSADGMFVLESKNMVVHASKGLKL